jgi:hypothetical protein
MGRSIQRTYWFLRAYSRFGDVHKTLEAGGFEGARKRFLKPWRSNSRDLNRQERLIEDIAWAVEKAKAWQLKKTECLPTSLCAYSLLRDAGAKPHFVMAVQSHPYAAHAWAHIGGEAIADMQMDEMRRYYTKIMQVPRENGPGPSRKTTGTAVTRTQSDNLSPQKVSAG